MNPEIRNCAWCDEPLPSPGTEVSSDDHDGNVDQFGILPMHVECTFRSIMGSVAHVEGRCSCYVDGASETDPPDMSRREAAKAALAAWRAQGHVLPRE